MELVRPFQQFSIHVQGIMVLPVQGSSLAVLAKRPQGACSHQSAHSPDSGEITIHRVKKFLKLKKCISTIL